MTRVGVAQPVERRATPARRDAGSTPASRFNEQHERELVCTRCDAHILVCCYVNDLDPGSYVGLACGCRRTKKAS